MLVCGVFSGAVYTCCQCVAGEHFT